MGKYVRYGFKGKGMTNHLLVDKQGHPLVIRATGANIGKKPGIFFVCSHKEISHAIAK